MKPGQQRLSDREIETNEGIWMSRDQLGDVAIELRAAYEAKRPIAPLRDRVAGIDIGSAYAIQEANTAYWVGQGRRLVGRKIGLTSRAVQKQLGVGQPDFGMLFADMACAEGEVIEFDAVLQPKIEAEIAFILDEDLPYERHTFADLIRAIAYCVPALEIVGSRIANWDIRIIDTVADNASSGLFVLGSRPVLLKDVDLTACTMRMRRGDEVVSEGNGRACLGNPLSACAWLADEMVKRRRPLKAGDIVMSGALGPMVQVCPGDQFEANVDGLGKVSASFSSRV